MCIALYEPVYLAHHHYSTINTTSLFMTDIKKKSAVTIDQSITKHDTELEKTITCHTCMVTHACDLNILEAQGNITRLNTHAQQSCIYRLVKLRGHLHGGPIDSRSIEFEIPSSTSQPMPIMGT